MGVFQKLFKAKETSAIKLMFNNNSIIGNKRHTNNWNIINKYSNSNNPLDILAVAVSYDREGAKYRIQAIEYYEKFLSDPAEIPVVPNLSRLNGTPKRYISNWEIYSNLANLYEKEYQFEKAIFYLNKLPKESNYNNPSDYTRIGDVLSKVNIDKCVTYYLDLMKTDIYKKFKNVIDIAYKNALEKQSKGYIFKPRKKKNT